MNARPYSGRQAAETPVSFDMTRASLMVFGPGIFITLIATTIWLASIW